MPPDYQEFPECDEFTALQINTDAAHITCSWLHITIKVAQFIHGQLPHSCQQFRAGVVVVDVLVLPISEFGRFSARSRVAGLRENRTATDLADLSIEPAAHARRLNSGLQVDAAFSMMNTHCTGSDRSIQEFAPRTVSHAMRNGVLPCKQACTSLGNALQGGGCYSCCILYTMHQTLQMRGHCEGEDMSLVLRGGAVARPLQFLCCRCARPPHQACVRRLSSSSVDQ
jgi:hypothetical protein